MSRRHVPLDALDSVEQAVHAMQIRERQCEICLYARDLGSAWGELVTECKKGLRRPARGRRCRGFRAAEGDG
ncbi:hypothetical protein [Halorhodospira sp. 9622]|uniref:hypothetical protein n=1 Tax=Halorhodospira sp. 9622 TaxID=2899136 RepID=UPI001EE8377D|nr:hypothetical protein [Halorhodospira sp. 9622]MCG5537876.1 hypothetical protein [Halorhodospira sp. 9622]